MATAHIPRPVAIARTLAAAFEAIRDLAKTSPAEADMLWESVAAHVRSTSPMSLQRPMLKVNGLCTNGVYEVARREAGVQLYASEGPQHDLVLTFTAAEAEAFERAFAAVRAGMEVANGR